MNRIITEILEAGIAAKREFIKENIPKIEQAAGLLADTLDRGNKILLFGNGGSAADCQHIAAEFVNRFRLERSPLAAMALTTDTSVLTSIGNDYSFDEIYSKQVEALGRKGDVALGISTSGNSPNVIRAVDAALSKGLHVIGFSGKAGLLKDRSGIAFCVNSETTARIQEVHIFLAHILCDLTERILFDA
ncbi:MAG: D-sedoheptulose 7-phosphate isomerase [Desulfobacteraceae bacterium]